MSRAGSRESEADLSDDGTSLCPVDVTPDSILTQIFNKLKRRKDPVIDDYLQGCDDNKVDFYRFEPPPARKAFNRPGGGYVVDNVDAIVKDLQKVKLDRFDSVGELFGEVSDLKHVPLYIEKPADTPDAIERRLSDTFDQLLPCLIVQNMGSWQELDIERNNASFVAAGTNTPRFVRDLIARLSRPKRYTDPLEEGGELLEACQKALNDKFNTFFAIDDGSRRTVTNPVVDYPIEFDFFQHVAAFSWSVGISGLDNERHVSELKASMVNNTFVNPPGLSHLAQKRARLAVGTYWPFNMFVRSQGVLHTYRPKSDFSYTTYDESRLIPIVIGQVMSNDQEADRWRMLCQAIALVRLGNHLTLSKAAATFVVMAIYIDSEFHADRYLLYQTHNSGAEVHIICDRFDLNDVHEGRTFLLNLYNFGLEIRCMTNNLNKTGFNLLRALVAEGSMLPLWSSRRANSRMEGPEDTRAPASPRVPTLPEVATESIQAAFDASEDMRVAIQQLGLTGDLFVVLGSSFVALVNSCEVAGQQYYLKLLRPGRTVEVNILSYLADIDSPDNHAIRPVASRACEKGTLLLLPTAGVPVPDYEDCQARLVSVASQFLRGVAFLHEHMVAHCDLKTSNVVVDRTTGRVTLIDFDLAVRGLDWLDGFSGTDGWTAPEVGVVARYNPIQADVWSAGKVLRTVAWKCFGSPDRQFLLDLSEKMMVMDPTARPSMKNVVEYFDRYVESHAGSEFPSATASNFGLRYMAPVSQPVIAM